jgi:glycosyltransferase involved in cell wall biosynthesis
LEATVEAKADKVLCVTDELAVRLTEIYGDRLKNKIHVIPNGYDQEEIDQIKKLEAFNSKFTITYCGKFYGTRNPLPLLEAVRQLITQNEIPPNELLIRFVGSCDQLTGVPLANILNEMGLSQLVTITGHVQRERALKYIMHSDALLLVPMETEFQIPVKFYEYLAAGKPMLALASKGAIKDIILNTKSGYAISPDDISSLKKAIKSLYNQWKEDKPLSKPSSEILTLYERTQLTGRFAELLNGLL